MLFKYKGLGLPKDVATWEFRMQGSGLGLIGNLVKFANLARLQCQGHSVHHQVRLLSLLLGLDNGGTTAGAGSLLDIVGLEIQDVSALTLAVMAYKGRKQRGSGGLEVGPISPRAQMDVDIDKQLCMLPHLRHIRFPNRHVALAQLRHCTHLSAVADTLLNVRIQFAVTLVQDPFRLAVSNTVEPPDVERAVLDSDIPMKIALASRALLSTQEQAAQLTDRLCFTRLVVKPSGMSISDADGLVVHAGAAKFAGHFLVSKEMEMLRVVDPSAFLAAFAGATPEELLGVTPESAVPTKRCVWLEVASDHSTQIYVERKTGITAGALESKMSLRLYGYDGREYFQPGAVHDARALQGALETMPAGSMAVVDIVAVQSSSTRAAQRPIACHIGCLAHVEAVVAPGQLGDEQPEEDRESLVLWPAPEGVIASSRTCLGLSAYLLEGGNGFFEFNHCAAFYTDQLLERHTCSRATRSLLGPHHTTAVEPNSYIDTPAIARHLSSELQQLNLGQAFSDLASSEGESKRRNTCLIGILMSAGSLEAKAMAMYTYHNNQPSPFKVVGTWCRAQRRKVRVVAAGWKVEMVTGTTLPKNLVVPVLDLTTFKTWAGVDDGPLGVKAFPVKVGPRSRIMTTLTPHAMDDGDECAIGGFGDTGAILLESILREGTKGNGPNTATLCVGTAKDVRGYIMPLTARYTWYRRHYGNLAAADRLELAGKRKMLYWKFVTPVPPQSRVDFVYRVQSGALATAIQELRHDLGYGVV